MVALQYLAELDKVNLFNKYKPIVLDMTKQQLETLVLLILNGCDVDYAFDITMSR